MSHIKEPLSPASLTANDARELALYREVFGEIPDCIVLKDHKGDFLLCNQTVARFYNTTPQAMVGKHDGDFGVSQEMADFFRQNVLGIMARGQTEVVFEESRDALTGETRHFKSIKRPFKDADGHNQILVIAHDITDVVQAQRRTAQSERRLQEVMEATREGIWDWHLATGRVSHNAQWYKILGFEHDEIDDHIDTYSQHLHPEDKSEVWKKLQSILAGIDDDYYSEHRMLCKDGAIIWVQDRGRVAERDTNGQPLRLIGSYADISERKHIEQELRLAATAFNAQVSIIVTDARGVIVKVNDTFEKETGYTPAEAVGQTPGLFKSGRHDTTFYQAMWASLIQVGVWEGEIWDRRKCGDIYPKWMVISAVKDDAGVTTHYVSTQSDLTERKAAESEISKLAYYDPLTHLPNRRLLLDHLHRASQVSLRLQRKGALLFIDLDHFKTLNDSQGHDKGDALLQQVAQRLKACVRDEDTVARLGGDEFIVLLENLSASTEGAATQTKMLSLKILTALNQPYLLDDHEYHGTASIGVTLFGNAPETMANLLKQADLAMYQAKAAGRNNLRFFDPQMQTAVMARVTLEKDLRMAVHQGQFCLHYQAQVDEAQQVMGSEVLLRWQHPERGLVLPGDFIDLAEETGLILPIGRWVLETACAQLGCWSTQPDLSHLTLAVNISVKQLGEADFVDQVVQAVQHHGAEPHKLKLEVTESLLIADVEGAIAKIKALKAHGIGFALDDFGTRYASLNYLKSLPLECLKIDRSFVEDIISDLKVAAIAKAIVVMSQGLGLAVIAEGVETQEQQDSLLRMGCRLFQGYLFSRPLPLEKFERLVSRNLLNRPSVMSAPGLAGLTQGRLAEDNPLSGAPSEFG